MQALLDDGNQHVCAYGDPDLRLHGVLACAQECLDAQVLLDPLEEQLDLPALTVKRGNHLWLECEVVGQESDALASLVAHDHSAQRRRIVFAGIKQCEHARLIAQHGGVDAIDGMGVAPLELGVALGADHKEGLCLMNGEQPGEVQVATIEQIERPGLQDQFVQHIDLVGLAIGDANEAGDRAAQVQQGVQLDGPLVERNGAHG